MLGRLLGLIGLEKIGLLWVMFIHVLWVRVNRAQLCVPWQDANMCATRGLLGQHIGDTHQATLHLGPPCLATPIYAHKHLKNMVYLA